MRQAMVAEVGQETRDVRQPEVPEPLLGYSEKEIDYTCAMEPEQPLPDPDEDEDDGWPPERPRHIESRAGMTLGASLRRILQAREMEDETLP